MRTMWYNVYIKKRNLEVKWSLQALLIQDRPDVQGKSKVNPNKSKKKRKKRVKTKDLYNMDLVYSHGT